MRGPRVLRYAGYAVRALLDTLYALSLAASALSLLAVAALVLAGMVGRWFGVVVPSADQLAGYCVAASIFFGLPAALRADTHIRVTLLFDRLPRTARWLLDLSTTAAGSVLVVMLTYSAAGMVNLSWRYHLVSSGLLPVPLWIPQTALLAGSAILAVALIERFLTRLFGAKRAHAA